MITIPQQYKRYLPYVGLCFLIVITLSSGLYFYSKYRQMEKLLKSSSITQSDELNSIISQLDKIIELPKDEAPTLATITDKAKLADQSFFVNAENGDRVLVYTNNKKIILFRPSTGKIIEVSSVNLSSPSATSDINQQLELDSEKAYRVILYNGTDVPGLTREYEIEIKEKLPNIEVVDRDNASKNNYLKSIIIDITGNKSDEAQKMANFLNLSFQPLPEGETASPSADFLIILGTDRT